MLARQPESQFAPDCSPAHRALSMLADLQKAHLRLLGAVQTLTKITGRASGDKVEYSTARFRLSEASLARRITFRTACQYLQLAACPADQQTIGRLRRADSELAQQASKHVNRWTMDRVDSDWPAYCLASKEIRRALLQQIQVERAMLYPLLHKHGSGRRSEIRLIPIDQFIAEEAMAG